MGCDGGTIARRADLVREKEKPQGKDERQLRHAQWFTCALSKEPIKLPIVTCGLGKLYNKEAILRFLLDKSCFGDGEAACAHITGLKDIVTLKAIPNAAFASPGTAVVAASADHPQTDDIGQFVCPVTGRETNGKFRFVALWKCGCLLSEQAMKEIPSKNCLQCAEPFSQDDIVIINGNAEDQELLRTRMQTRRRERKAAAAASKEASALSSSMAKEAGSTGETHNGSKRRAEQPAPAAHQNAPRVNAPSKLEGSVASLKKTKAVSSLYIAPADQAKAQKTDGSGFLCRTFNRYAA